SNPRLWTARVLEPRRIADRLSDRLTELLRDPARGHASGEPPRLEDEDLAPLRRHAPLKQGPGDARCLAGAARRRPHEVRASPGALADFGQERVDGKGLHGCRSRAWFSNHRSQQSDRPEARRRERCLEWIGVWGPQRALLVGGGG